MRPQGYVHNPNTWMDPLGLAGCATRTVNGTNIYGKGQQTGPGHAQLSELLANKLAMSGKFKEVHINRSYESITGIATSPRRLPDITAVGHDGKLHPIEIASRTDMGSKYPSLLNRNNAALGQLPANQRGNVLIIDHPYSAANIKVQVDNWLGGI